VTAQITIGDDALKLRVSIDDTDNAKSL